MLETDPRTGQEFIFKPQPGEFADSPIEDDYYETEYSIEAIKERIIQAVIADGIALGFTFIEVPDGSIETTDNSWVVALAIGFDYYMDGNTEAKVLGDYHWWRKDANGKWSHKPGLAPIMYTDFSYVDLIDDPQNCNRDYYECFLGYFYITWIKEDAME